MISNGQKCSDLPSLHRWIGFTQRPSFKVIRTLYKGIDSTGRLSEKSDVYSFGVLLIELLTRKRPNMYLSSEGEGLVLKFGELHAEGNLSEIVDPQVAEEGGRQIVRCKKWLI